MSENLRLLKRSFELIDRSLQIRLGALAVVALVISGLDALGVLLMLPLAKVVGNGEESIDLPLWESASPTALLGASVGLFIGKSVATAVLRWWTLGVTLRSGSRAATKMFDRYMAAPVSFYDSRNSADAVRTVMVSVRNFFQQGVIGATNLIAESITLVVLVIVLLVQSPITGLVAFVYFGLAIIFFGRVVQRNTTRLSTETQNLTAEGIQLVQEGLGALTELRVRQTTRYVTGPFGQKQDEIQKSRRVVLFAGELARYYLEIVFVGAVGLVAGSVLLFFPSDEFLPTLALFLVVGFRALPSISRLLVAANSVRVGRSSLGIVCEDLDAMKAAGREESSLEKVAVPGPARLLVDNIDFAYSSELVLDGISIDLEPGGSLGLLGSSGSGKSTLLEIICGLRSPSGGKVDVRPEGAQESETASIGYVPQSVFTIDCTVFENVTLGREATEEQVWEALETACAADFVRALPQGLLTNVGESGTLLSGGQRQRLGLARACLTRPGLLILDEATSALDSETEASVVCSLNQLREHTSLVVVTHRPSTLRFCDSVLEISDGRAQKVTADVETIDLEETEARREVTSR